DRRYAIAVVLGASEPDFSARVDWGQSPFLRNRIGALTPIFATPILGAHADDIFATDVHGDPGLCSPGSDPKGVEAMFASARSSSGRRNGCHRKWALTPVSCRAKGCGRLIDPRRPLV